jgi:hypothetical protein
LHEEEGNSPVLQDLQEEPPGREKGRSKFSGMDIYGGLQECMETLWLQQRWIGRDSSGELGGLGQATQVEGCSPGPDLQVLPGLEKVEDHHTQDQETAVKRERGVWGRSLEPPPQLEVAISQSQPSQNL